MFDGVENRISAAMFAIPAVKGIEFGSGFAAANMHGSEHNDAFYFVDGRITTMSNHHGGILGGITSGTVSYTHLDVYKRQCLSRWH